MSRAVLLTAGRAIRLPPRYLAQLPWLGPIQGEAFPAGAEQHLRVGAAADPLLGDAMLSLFQPVVRRNGRFVPVPGTGWVMPVRRPDTGRFRLEPPLAWWQGPIAGVLMLLLYDRSYTLVQPKDPSNPKARRHQSDFPLTWQGQLEKLEAKLDPQAPARIAELPEKMRVEIETRLEQLLRLPAGELEPGLIELDRRPPAGEITFAVASCQYPANFIDRDVAQRSYERLRARVESRDARLRPRCLLLVGDQVYIDATAGLFDPSTLSDRYDLPYERLLQTQPLRHVLRRIPLYTMLDDHEIEDNWEPLSGSQKNLDEGRAYYRAYQRMAWPDPVAADRLWYSFEANGFPFFMADTRTERKARRAENLRRSSIMSMKQLRALTGWLDRHKNNDVPKFIISPSAFLPRHRKATHGPGGAGALRSDSWDGYPTSFHAIVKRIVRNGMKNVVFLSGDEHISFATKAVVRDGAGKEVTRILSIHSSGLYAPFAFANSTQDNLACCETFDAGGYRLTVSTEFASPGDGFALIRAARENGRWRICCLFDREPPAPEIWIDLA